jgi:hypothetical protein
MEADMATATGTKSCVKCGKDVTHDKRMKDSQGQYWCLPCGELDKKDRQERVACADCRVKYPASEMTSVGGEMVCAGCMKGRASAGGSGGGKGEGRAGADAVAKEANRAMLMKAIAAGALLLLGGGLIVLYAMDVI